MTLEIFIWSILAVVALVIVGIVIGMYNALVRLKHNIEKAWANIDVLLKQRHDELPKLIDTVKRYMKHEKDVLTEITKARTEFTKAGSVTEKAKADNMVEQALKSIFAVAENYPDLKASDNFKQLQARISSIEESLSDRREFYNDSTNTYNIRINQIPYNILARALSYQQKPLFEASEAEKRDIKVKF